MLKKINPTFVKNLPNTLEDGVLYISMEYRISRHLCCCGCGESIDIMFSPTDWQLIYDGPTVSIEPSIGNWSYSCQSHYYITKNNVIKMPKWKQGKINKNRKQDIENKNRFHKKKRFWDKLFG